MKRFPRFAAFGVLALLVGGSLASTAEAGRYRYAAPSACASGNCPSAVPYAAPVRYVAPQPVQAPAGYTAAGRPLYNPVYRVATAPATVVGQVAHAANPLAWVNAIRARYGCRALAYDANLSAYAAQNNAACSRRGLGHHVMAGCDQNAAGTSDPNYAATMWLNSPAHRVQMLNPNATVAGIDHSYGYATLNVR